MRINKVLLGGFAVIAGLSIGVKNVNAASVTVTDTLPETVTRGEITHAFASGTVAETGKSNYPFYNESNDGKYLLYCSDRNNPNYSAGDVLTKDTKLDDGIAYILSQSHPTKSTISNIVAYYEDTSNNITTVNDAVPNTMANVWITQMAIWGYQGSISLSNISDDPDNGIYYRASEDGSSNLSERAYTLSSGGTTGQDVKNNRILPTNVLWTKTSSLISGAKSYSNSATNATLSITQDITWTKEDDVTKSSIITVTSDNDVKTFKLEFVDAPEDTKVYNEDGSEITDLSSIAIGTKFYITVPNDKVSSGEASFKINASSTGKFLAAYKYVDKANGHQPSVLAGYEERPLTAELNLTIAPDTASTISRTIYFLGFIILISGVGIIYANIKPKQQA